MKAVCLIMSLFIRNSFFFLVFTAVQAQVDDGEYADAVNEELHLWIGEIERFHNSDIRHILAIQRGYCGYGSQKYRKNPQWQSPV